MAAYRIPAVDLTGNPARNDLRPPPRPQCSQVSPAADSRKRSHEAINLIGSPPRNALSPPPSPQCSQIDIIADSPERLEQSIQDAIEDAECRGYRAPAQLIACLRSHYLQICRACRALVSVDAAIPRVDGLLGSSMSQPDDEPCQLRIDVTGVKVAWAD